MSLGYRSYNSKHDHQISSKFPSQSIPKFHMARLYCVINCTFFFGGGRWGNVEVISFRNKSSPGISTFVELELSYETLNKHLKFPGTAYKLAISFQLHAMTFFFPPLLLRLWHHVDQIKCILKYSLIQHGYTVNGEIGIVLERVSLVSWGNKQWLITLLKNMLKAKFKKKHFK